MSSRKAMREALATLITSGVSSLQAVYDHEPKNFDGKSPVAMISSLATARGPMSTHDGAHRQHVMRITLLIKRADDDTVEDALDDLSDLVFDVLEANATGANWGRMLPDTTFGPDADYPDIDGAQYRREFIRVVLWE